MLQELRRRFSHIAGPLIGLSAVTYFAYHTVEGDRGVLSYLRLHGEILDAEMRLAKVSSELQEMEHRVLLLRPDHLDPDMLEERARSLLEWVDPRDLVMIERKP